MNVTSVECNVRKSSSILCIAFLFVFLLCIHVQAQVNTADLVGTVTDPSGAVLPNAEVTIKNLGTGQTHAGKSGASGDFSFTFLQVGTYTTTVQAQGFKSFTSSNVTLAAGDRARVDAKMEVGQQGETVEVQATTPALQTDTSTLGALIGSKAVQDLPLNGRNFIQLVQNAPGVSVGLGNALSSGTRPDDRRQTSSYSANGQTDEVNNNMIDGLDNNERIIGTIGVRPSPDAIQEVKVQTNLYTAEVGRSAGGVVDVITKSGTNNLHGSLFEYIRNDVFDANTWTQRPQPGRKKSELRQNQYGGSLGGPIIKNKTFFFGDYEGFRLRQGQTFTSQVPTLYQEQHPGDFSDLCLTPGTPCNGGPILTAGQISPIGLNYFKLYPAPNVAVPLPGIVNGKAQAPTGNFTFSPARKQDSNIFDMRVDHHFNEQNTFFGRYSFNNVSTVTPDPLPAVNGVEPGGGDFGANFPGNAKERQQSLGLQFVHVFRPSLLLELRAGYLRSTIASLPLNYGKSLANQLGFSCNSINCINVPGQPVTSGLPGMQSVGGYALLGDADFVPLTQVDNAFQYAGTLNWSRGSHSIKIGTGVIRRQALIDQSSYMRGGLMSFAGDFNGNGAADLLAGQSTSITRGNSLIAPRFRTWEPYGFVQDDWRAKHWLTLNLGVRYDIFTPYTTRNGAFSNFDFGTNLLVSPSLPGAQHASPTNDIKTDYRSVAPRLGFAATLGHGTVLRGGFGMSYFPGNYTGGAAMKNAPFKFTFTCGIITTSAGACTGPLAGPAGNYQLSSLPVPVLDVTNATDPAKYLGTSIDATDFNYKNSYIHQFSLQLQKDLAGNVFGVGYVGNHGHRLTVRPNVNQRAFAGAPFPIPTLPGVLIAESQSQAISRYNALQLTYERRLSRGLAVNANYTWSHNITNGPIVDEGQPAYNCVGLCHVDIPDAGAPNPATFRTVNSWPVYDLGNADIDLRHRVSVMLNYDLPFGKSLSGMEGGIVKGWSVNGIYSWQSGLPFTVQNNSSLSGIGLGNDRPNQIASTKLSNPTSFKWFNTDAFAPQAAGTLGDERRNQLFGPPASGLDMSLFKSFPIREDLRVQFRAESFNLLNTPSLNNPNSTLGQSAFGQITSASRGPRTFQFALKVLF